MSDKMKTYFKNQTRSESVKIKPGLKEVAESIAADLFPCALVSADDAIEYLISMYATLNEIDITSNNVPNNYTSYNVTDNSLLVNDETLSSLYQTLQPITPVILPAREENIYDVHGQDAGNLDFKL